VTERAEGLAGPCAVRLEANHGGNHVAAGVVIAIGRDRGAKLQHVGPRLGAELGLVLLDLLDRRRLPCGALDLDRVVEEVLGDLLQGQNEVGRAAVAHAGTVEADQIAALFGRVVLPEAGIWPGERDGERGARRPEVSPTLASPREISARPEKSH
jgi:hypothetical protein